MSFEIIKVLFSFVAPGGLIFLVTMIFLRWFATPESISAVVHVFPYIIFGAGIVLGWRFNRSKIVFAMVTLMLADRLLLHDALGHSKINDAGNFVFDTVAFLLPWNFMILSNIKERGTFTKSGMLRIGLILSQVAIVAVWYHISESTAVALLNYQFVNTHLLDWTPLAQTALLSFFIGFVVLTIRFLLNPKAIESGFVWSLVAAFMALNVDITRQISSIYFATGGLILIICLVEASYILAYRDELTRLPTRRSLNEALLKLGSHYTMAMIDVDYFKRFNDKYGHSVGDQVLKMVAAKIANISGRGKGFRFGGEEFVVIFPGKSKDEAMGHLERLRKTIENTVFSLRGPDRPRKKPKKNKPVNTAGKKIGVTVSIGVAERDNVKENPEQVIKAADKALYRAKQAGRNRINN